MRGRQTERHRQRKASRKSKRQRTKEGILPPDRPVPPKAQNTLHPGVGTSEKESQTQEEREKERERGREREKARTDQKKEIKAKSELTGETTGKVPEPSAAAGLPPGQA
jgi:hypothetical protein